FNWKTFGDGDGFVADLIVAGALQGGKVKFDLTNGTFLIGESTEDYLIYFDGTNLNFAQGREYTWEDIDADNKTWNDIDADNKTWLEVIRSPLYSPYQLTHDLGALESDFGRTLSLISDEETLDLMERAIGGKTLIKGGYINTQLVAAQSILANMIKVNDLSAISANIGTVIAGLLKSANGESFFDLTNNRLVTNSGKISGFTITDNTLSASFSKTFGPFTQSDVTRVQNITLGITTPTQSDYNKYDMGGKGYLNIIDLAEVNKMVLGVKPNPQAIQYTLTLNTADMRELIKLSSSLSTTTIGTGGINTQAGKFNRVDTESIVVGKWRLSINQETGAISTVKEG
ncbi:MAG TPA: hypothetical protein VFC75_03350, partial [Erysipelothrix sp.]|nr:hypothetical protein [Erysipelothrix sp.]